MLLNFINKLKAKNINSIYILTHNFPDVDALSSAFGLQTILKQYAIKSTIVYSGLINRVSTEKLVNSCGIKAKNIDGNFNDDDYIFCIDCQKGENNVKINGGIYLGCIDHHPNVSKDVKAIYKQIHVTGSCATLITKEFKNLKLEMNEIVATALLYGLKMDTSDFTRGVTSLDIDMFKLLNNKASFETLNYLETSSMVLKDLKSFGAAIENIKIISDFGTSFVPFDCEDGLIAMLSEFILGLEEVNVSIVFSLRKNGIKLSVRSILPFINAGQLVREALAGIGSGGGHAMFAGGFIPKENITETDNNKIQNKITALFLKTYGKIILSSVEKN